MKFRKWLRSPYQVDSWKKNQGEKISCYWPFKWNMRAIVVRFLPSLPVAMNPVVMQRYETYDIHIWNFSMDCKRVGSWIHHLKNLPEVVKNLWADYFFWGKPLVILPEVAASLLESDHYLARKKQKLCMKSTDAARQIPRADRVQVIRLCSLLKNIFVAYLPYIIRHLSRIC
jgi:hypothetical protein